MSRAKTHPPRNIKLTFLVASWVWMHPLSLLSVVSKVFEKLVNNTVIELLITQRNVVFFFISGMVLSLLDQLQIFLQLYLIELLRLITGLGPLKLQHLIYPRLLAGFGMLVFFTNVSLMEFQARFLFSVIDSLQSFWMASLHKNIQLMLEFLKAAFLVLHFSYYTLTL